MKSILASLLITVIAISCQKEKQPTKVDYLIDAEWKYLFMGFDLDKDGKIESSSISHCLLDNEINFFDNGTGVEDENLVSCPMSDPRFPAFEWELSQDQSRIKITGDSTINFLGDFQIILLNNTHMSLRTERLNPNTQQTEWWIYNFVQD